MLLQNKLIENRVSPKLHKKYYQNNKNDLHANLSVN